MSEPSLSASELLDWNNETVAHWQSLVEAHPEILDLKCDIYGTGTVLGLFHHIFVVETRYAQRLSGEPVSSYEEIPKNSFEDLIGVHETAMAKYRGLLAGTAMNWDEVLEVKTLSAGTLHVTRGKILLHAMLHGIRHYAQLATLVRKHGIKPNWPMDYLMCGMELSI
jgi:uncharacterized damage-inducible protein DinB